MFEIFWDVPFWVHITIIIATPIISGAMSIDEKGKILEGGIGASIVFIIAVVFFWQLFAVIITAIAVLSIPFVFGMFLRKALVKFNKRYDKKDVKDIKTTIFEENNDFLKKNKYSLKKNKYSEIC